MDENIKMAFTFAADSTKQLIVISTAILAFTITFSKDFLGNRTYLSKRWIVASWIFLLLSILFGIVTLLALTGTLERIPVDQLSIYRANIAVPASLQIGCFIAALVCAITGGARSLRNEQIALNIASAPPKIILTDSDPDSTK